MQFESILNDIESLKLTAEDERTAFEEKATALEQDLLEQRNQNAAQLERAKVLEADLFKTRHNLSKQRAHNATYETLMTNNNDRIAALEAKLVEYAGKVKKQEGIIETQAERIQHSDKVVADMFANQGAADERLVLALERVSSSPERSSPQAQGQSSLLQQASEAWKSAHNKRPSDPVLAQSPRRRSSKRRKPAHMVVEPDSESSEAPSSSW